MENERQRRPSNKPWQRTQAEAIAAMERGEFNPWGSAPKGAAADAPPEPHPAPLVPVRPATPAEIPGGARAVQKTAQAAGWNVEPTYALGYLPVTNRAPVLAASLALRMRKAARYAVACWSTRAATNRTTLEGAWVVEDKVMRVVTAAELRDFLKSEKHEQPKKA